MARKKTPKNQDTQPAEQKPWLSMQSGLIIVGIVSIGLAIWTTQQALLVKEPLEAVLWGLAFGGSIWLVYFGSYLFNRLIRRR
jgi:hypothetical protein